MADEKPISERVSVLETQVDSHAVQLEKNQELSMKLIDRLDKHMESNASRDIQIQENLTQVTVAVGELTNVVAQTNTTLQTIAGITNSNNKTITIWDTSTRAVVKFLVAIVCIIGLGASVVQIQQWIETYQPHKVADGS